MYLHHFLSVEVQNAHCKSLDVFFSSLSVYWGWISAWLRLRRLQHVLSGRSPNVVVVLEQWVNCANCVERCKLRLNLTHQHWIVVGGVQVFLGKNTMLNAWSSLSCFGYRLGFCLMFTKRLCSKTLLLLLMLTQNYTEKDFMHTVSYLTYCQHRVYELAMVNSLRQHCQIGQYTVKQTRALAETIKKQWNDLLSSGENCA